MCAARKFGGIHARTKAVRANRSEASPMIPKDGLKEFLAGAARVLPDSPVEFSTSPGIRPHSLRERCHDGLVAPGGGGGEAGGAGRGALL